MKTKSALLLVAGFAGLLFANVALAQTVDASTGNVTADNIVQWITPILVPLVIAGLKKIVPSIPGALLPIIAPLLGVVADLINHLATGHSTNLLVAAALGLAGVGVREVKDQIAPPAPKATSQGT